MASASDLTAVAVDWHVMVEPAGQSGADNMAWDDALLREADRSGAAFLRLYRWAPPCLSFGRNEPALTLYDRAAIARLGLAVVRRPTGGRAVWHEHEVTYAVAAPIAPFGGLRAAHRAIHTRLAAALHSLGADAALAPARPPGPLSAGPCFAAPVGGEVMVGGRKVVGSAQVRLRAAFLQHGSILLDGSQDVVRRVSRAPVAGSGETTLAAALGRPVTFDEAAAAIVEAWWDVAAPSAGVRPGPPASAPFADPAWTWRR